MKALRAAAVVLSLALFALLAFCIAGRLAFPFELEWMEGATLMHVRRVAQGLPLYVQPTIDFVPFAYPPLYYYVCVPFAWLLGANFAAMRLVSVLATGATLILVWLTVKRHSGGLAGTLAAGMFAGCYALSDGRRLDLGRADGVGHRAAGGDVVRCRARAVAVYVDGRGAPGMRLSSRSNPPGNVLVPLGALLLGVERKHALVFVVVAVVF